MRVSYYFLLLGILLCMPIYGQQVLKINGNVKDAKLGGPLPGVSVLVKGTTNGTSADFDGNYTISAKSTDVLVFSFIGYKTLQVPVSGKTKIDVSLSEESNQLDEIVVVGYGTSKRKDITGSVASIKGKDLASYPVANISTAMQGKVAGVTVTAMDGRPDAKVSIRVRGGGSITQSNDPLFIVDGFPVSNINDIPASQIASIDVLKDASSTAIYGARGANGVVLVTTKAPSGGKVSITYNGSTQIKSASNHIGALGGYDFVKMNWDFGTLMGATTGDSWASEYGLGTKYSNLNPAGINAYKTADYRDIEREVIRSTTAYNHNIAITGGNEKTRYSVSFDNLDDNGLKIESYYKRTNILAKIKSEIAKNLDFEGDIYYSNQEVFGNEDQTSSVGSWLTRALMFTPVTPLGNRNTNLGVYESYVKPQFDPIPTIKDIYDKTLRQKYRGNVALTWRVNDALTLRSEYSASKDYSSRYQYTGSVAKNTVGVEGGDATITKDYDTRYRFVNTANYKFQNLGENHKLDLLLGQEVNGTDGERTRLTGTKYPLAYDYNRVFAAMGQYGNQNEIRIFSNEKDPMRLASFFGRVNYALKDRYLFTATLRADASSNFPPSNRWGYFPAAAFAWRVSNESFLKDSKTVSDLKVRLSYGEAGNDQIAAGLWRPEWTGASGYGYNNVPNGLNVPASTMLTNPNLKWETTITRNLGIDYGFFDNRLYGTIDVYWNTTEDLLMVNTLPAYTGYVSQMDNIGQTRNTGLEFTIGGDIVRKEDFKLSANLNISINRNEVEELSPGVTSNYYTSGWGSSTMQPVGGDYGFKVGEPVGLIRGYKYAGFYTTADFNYDAVTKAYTLKPGVSNSIGVLGNVGGSGAIPGMLKLEKLGTTSSATNINEIDDLAIIGNTTPKFTGGLNINASYKSLDLLLGFNGSYGNDIYNVNKLSNSFGNKLPFHNFSPSTENAYTLFDVNAAGDLVRIYDPAALDALNANATTYMPFHEKAVVHSDGIEDGSFIRLNNVTLGYTLPSDVSNKVGMQNFRIYATVINAWLWTKYTGYDPEVDAGNGRNGTYPTPGMDFGAYPKARTFTLGVNVKF
ncbi:TonB-linked outer membrane protein, SusC/RagA family [Flavobacterium fluvii]|uniref:TonB-linked outer membrane protein, SusC/RagA family n=2 Tax=Flavobacterium fluvii TaxID=468056 RepID=A0A1M5IH77_9FLAO|nr:TonB-linked outer membrane protein, SusC/RagA family [Flavobacterium fluvii]